MYVFGLATFYPEVQFELSRTINSHQADIVNLRDWGKDSSCIKRTTPEQMGCFALLTKPKAKDQTPSWWPVHRGFHKRNSKSILTGSDPNIQLFSIRKSLSSSWLYLKHLKKPNRKCSFIFRGSQEPRAKIECHFNELSQWGATCFIRIIGWLATLKRPLLGTQYFFLSFPLFCHVYTLYHSRISITNACGNECGGVVCL